MTLRALLEERSTVVAEMRALTAAPAGTGGDLSDDQAKKFDEFKLKLDGIEKRITRQQTIDDAERRMQGQPVHGEPDKFDELVRGFSLTRLIASQIDRTSVDAGRELEVSKELARRIGKPAQGAYAPLNALVPQLEKRVQAASGDVSNLIATDVLASEFIDALRPATVLGRLGARILTGLQGNVSVPKMDSMAPSVEWLEVDGSSYLTGGDHSFTAIGAEPHVAGLLTTWSRKTILQANPAIEQLVRSDFVRKLAAGVDYAGLRGSGAAGQPKGILGNNNISAEILSGNAVAWANVLGMIAQVQGADVPGARLGFTFNSHVQKKLRGTTKVSNDAAAGFIMDTPDSLAGYPVAITSQMAGDPTVSPDVPGVMLFGDFSQVIVLFWGSGAADVLVNPYSDDNFTKGNVSIRAFVDADILLRYDEAFCKATGIALT